YSVFFGNEHTFLKPAALPAINLFPVYYKGLILRHLFMHRIFIALYYLIERNRLVAALLALSFLIVGIFYASKIKFEEDISQMLPKNGKSDITAQVLSQLEFSDKIIVLINSRTNGDQLTETADAFIESLEPL